MSSEVKILVSLHVSKEMWSRTRQMLQSPCRGWSWVGNDSSGYFNCV